MKPRTLLILLVLVLGLGAFIAFYERKLPSSDERSAEAKKVFAGLKKEDVSAVGLQWTGHDVRLERVAAAKPSKPKEETQPEATETAPPADEWKLVRPLAARADSTAVAGLLETLLNLEQSRVLESYDAKEVGLDHPQATIRLKTADGEKVLRVGSAIPTAGSMVVAFEGEKQAYVVADSLLSGIQRDPGEWRDKLVFHGDREAVERITLSRGADRVVLAKRGTGFWIEGSTPDRADRELIDGLLSDLTGLRALRFLDTPPPPATLGLEPPQGVVEVAMQGSQPPLRIELGSPAAGSGTAPGQEAAAPAIHARLGAQVFETQTSLSAALARPAADWRSGSLSVFENYQVQSARFRDAQGEVALQRDGADWKRGKDPIGYTPVSDLLYSISTAKGNRLLGAAEAQQLGAAFDKPDLTITLKGDTGEETLTLAPAVAGGVPARSSGRAGVVLLLPQEAAAEIRQHLGEVRAAQPEKPAPAEKAEG